LLILTIIGRLSEMNLVNQLSVVLEHFSLRLKELGAVTSYGLIDNREDAPKEIKALEGKKLELSSKSGMKPSEKFIKER
jgi:hypothetical protein